MARPFPLICTTTVAPLMNFSGVQKDSKTFSQYYCKCLQAQPPERLHLHLQYNSAHLQNNAARLHNNTAHKTTVHLYSSFCRQITPVFFQSVKVPPTSLHSMDRDNTVGNAISEVHVRSWVRSWVRSRVRSRCLG